MTCDLGDSVSLTRYTVYHAIRDRVSFSLVIYLVTHLENSVQLGIITNFAGIRDHVEELHAA